ncbi:hypothetical protein FKW77_009648 [Venturia effusa]|uniref:Major facilitator superfamily (MFS) profile domain-containing protein n=1 Tax=Venturia effusa TaxID=50376 RepID=A0A517L645_9PEZI|nr:hypothetical protein FKW77_009648 [Venturia effusa]
MDAIENTDITAGRARKIPASANSSTHSETDHEDSIHEETLRPQPSRTSSYRSASYYPPIVPRHLRRGLLSRFTLVPEVTQPYHYPNRTKWLITFTVALAAAAAPMGSAIIMPSLGPMSRDFEVSSTIANLSVALYMLSMSIFPLWWSSFSETLGRRTIYVVSFVLFVLWAILSAVSTNIAMFIVMRVLSGGAAASVQAVGAGTIADIWEPKERGRAMGLFYLGPLMGPFLAPIIGGALAEGLGWRSTQWFLVIYGGVLIIFLVFALPETLKARKKMIAEAAKERNAILETKVAMTGDAGGQVDVEKEAAIPEIGRTTTLQRTVTTRSVAEKSRKCVKLLKRCFVDPLKIILLLRFPAVSLTVIWASITFGCLYFLNISIETTFSKAPYNFSTLIVGLLYIPNSVGYLIASLFGGRWLDYIMKREAKKAGRIDEKGRLFFRPEDRMKENAWIAGSVFPLALIWYGWTAEKGVFWVVPMIANFFFGLGSMIMFAMATTMLTEFMPKRASNGIAVNNFMRNIFSCVGGIIAAPLIKAIGNGWLCTILGIIALVVGGGLHHFGRMTMLSNDDLLERAAATGTFDLYVHQKHFFMRRLISRSDEWPRILDDLLNRLDSIVRSHFPTPSLPPAPPQPRTLGSPLPAHADPSSQDSTASNKENAPTRLDGTRPPVPTFENEKSPRPPRSRAPGEYPPELTMLHESIKSTLKSGFSKYPPHTIQRLAELILFPKRHYRYLPPYLNALDRVVNVSSNTTVFPLPHTSLPGGGVLNGVSAINDVTASTGPALGSDESLGGALLTPIPWLSPAGRVSSQSERELLSESTEMVDGPNGAGRIETVSVVNGVMTTSSVPAVGSRASVASTSAAPIAQTHIASTEQTLRAEGAVTQGELLRQEQQAGVVANPPRSLRMSEAELGSMEVDENGEEKPHARGPDEIGMEDTGPQEKPPGAGLDMEAAVGRSRRESSVERDISPQDSALSDAGKDDETMKDADSAPSNEAENGKEAETSDNDVIIGDASGKIEEETKDEAAGEEK